MDSPKIDIETIALMARNPELLDAEACAFLLCIRDRSGAVSRRGFLERVAIRGSFPRPIVLPDVGKRWRREDVVRWAEDEAKIAAREGQEAGVAVSPPDRPELSRPF